MSGIWWPRNSQETICKNSPQGCSHRSCHTDQAWMKWQQGPDLKESTYLKFSSKVLVCWSPTMAWKRKLKGHSYFHKTAISLHFWYRKKCLWSTNPRTSLRSFFEQFKKVTLQRPTFGSQNMHFLDVLPVPIMFNKLWVNSNSKTKWKQESYFKKDFTPLCHHSATTSYLHDYLLYCEPLTRVHLGLEFHF